MVPEHTFDDFVYLKCYIYNTSEHANMEKIYFNRERKFL